MKKLLLLSLAAIALFSCSKHDDDNEPGPWPPAGDYNEFQLHYFVPTAFKNTVVADSLFINGVLYTDNKTTGVMKSYRGLPGYVHDSKSASFFVGYNNMNIKLFKEKSLIYDQNAGNLQTGGRYHLVVYDLEKPPIVFTRTGITDIYGAALHIVFANILFQNPTTKYPGIIRLQYSHMDEEDWTTVGSAVKFGEATTDYSIVIPDQYQTLIFRVVDQNGTVLSSGEEGKDIKMAITPDFSSPFAVIFLGGNIEDGQAADLFQWKSL